MYTELLLKYANAAILFDISLLELYGTKADHVTTHQLLHIINHITSL